MYIHHFKNNTSVFLYFDKGRCEWSCEIFNCFDTTWSHNLFYCWDFLFLILPVNFYCPLLWSNACYHLCVGCYAYPPVECVWMTFSEYIQCRGKAKRCVLWQILKWATPYLFIYLFLVYWILCRYLSCVVFNPLFYHGNWPIRLSGLVGLRPLTQVLNNLYAVGEWPRDFTEVTMIASKEEARSYKMQWPLQNQLHCTYSKDSSEDAYDKNWGCTWRRLCGFRRENGTREESGLLRIMSEQSLDIIEELCAFIIDWQKAFDHVN